MAHTVHAAGCIIQRREKGKALFLLLKSQKGVWGFPKGKKDGNENERDTALRELREETEIEDLFFIPGFRRALHYKIIKNGHRIKKTVTLFGCETPERRVRISSEHAAYAWLSHRDALARLPFEDLKHALKQFHIYIARKHRLLEVELALWNMLRRVPKGKVITYRRAARALGISARETGALAALNYDRRVPCHRMVHADGHPGGYNRGVKNKISLLRKEGVKFRGSGSTLRVEKSDILY